jgi:chaperonin GroES
MVAKTSIKPLFDYVLIKPLAREEVTASGIVLPDTVKEKPQMGEVMAVGEGFTSQDGRESQMSVKVGQKVIYKKWGGDEVKVGNDEWLLTEQKNIMAILS